jgi:hypothetical protein
MSMDQNEMRPRPNVVLVHGAWADGSSWTSVIERLQADRYHVTAPQFPLTSLTDDVARLRQVLALQDGPTVIAGHSYGGQVMTALGTDHRTSSVWSTSRPSDSTRVSRSGGCWRRDLRLRHWPTRSSTTKDSPGCQRTTSSTTSQLTSIRSRQRCCTPCNNRCP